MIATMPLSSRSFPAIERSVRFKRVMFSTVGALHIKCLKPEALFCLPMIDIRGCESKGDIEERIRTLKRVSRALAKLNTACANEQVPTSECPILDALDREEG